IPGRLFESARPNRSLGDPVADEADDVADQLVDVVPQAREVSALLDARLVHVEAAVDLDLQAVASGGRIAVADHDLGALEGMVEADAVAETAQGGCDEVG